MTVMGLSMRTVWHCHPHLRVSYLPFNHQVLLHVLLLPFVEGLYIGSQGLRYIFCIRSTLPCLEIPCLISLYSDLFLLCSLHLCFPIPVPLFCLNLPLRFHLAQNRSYPVCMLAIYMLLYLIFHFVLLLLVTHSSWPKFCSSDSLSRFSVIVTFLRARRIANNLQAYPWRVL